jgi:hypothetical protein
MFGVSGRQDRVLDTDEGAATWRACAQAWRRERETPLAVREAHEIAALGGRLRGSAALRLTERRVQTDQSCRRGWGWKTGLER